MASRRVVAVGGQNVALPPSSSTTQAITLCRFDRQMGSPASRIRPSTASRHELQPQHELTCRILPRKGLPSGLPSRWLPDRHPLRHSARPAPRVPARSGTGCSRDPAPPAPGSPGRSGVRWRGRSGAISSSASARLAPRDAPGWIDPPPAPPHRTARHLHRPGRRGQRQRRRHDRQPPQPRQSQPARSFSSSFSALRKRRFR